MKTHYGTATSIEGDGEITAFHLSPYRTDGRPPVISMHLADRFILVDWFDALPQAQEYVDSWNVPSLRKEWFFAEWKAAGWEDEDLPDPDEWWEDPPLLREDRSLSEWDDAGRANEDPPDPGDRREDPSLPRVDWSLAEWEDSDWADEDWLDPEDRRGDRWDPPGWEPPRWDSDDPGDWETDWTRWAQ